MIAIRAIAPLGTIGIETDNGKLTRLFFTDLPANQEEDDFTRSIFNQLEEYLAGKRKSFTISLAPHGTPFQQAVWAALCDIPYGEVRSYGDIARAIGRPTASRAVGMANHRNPIGILIPCHRVIGANGSLTGYAGGLAIKSALLQLESPDKNWTSLL